MVTFKFPSSFSPFGDRVRPKEGSKRARLLDFFKENPLAGYREAAEAVGTTVGYARKVLCLERREGRRHRFTKKDYIFRLFITESWLPDKVVAKLAGTTPGYVRKLRCLYRK